MSSFFSIFKDECGFLSREKYLSCLLFFAPLWIVCLLAFSVTTDIKGSRMAILDVSHDAMTENIANRFSQNKYFTLVGETESFEQLDEWMRKGYIDIALVFGQEYAESILHLNEANIQIVADGSDNQATMRTSYAQRLLSEYQKEAMLASGMKPTFMIVPEMKMLYNPYQRGDTNILPGGISLIIFIICTLMGCMSFSRNSGENKYKKLLKSSVPTKTIIFAKSLPYILLASFSFLFIILITAVLHISPTGNFGGLICAEFFYIVASVFLGQFIAIAANDKFTGLLIAGMVMFGVSILLSGFIFPVTTMPDWLQYVADIVPAQWDTCVIKKLFVQGLSVKHIWNEIIALCIFLLLFFVAATGSLSKYRSKIKDLK